MKVLILQLLMLLISCGVYGQLIGSTTTHIGGDVVFHRAYYWNEGVITRIVETDASGDMTTEILFTDGRISNQYYYQRVGGVLWEVKHYDYVYRSASVMFGDGGMWTFKNRGTYYWDDMTHVARKCVLYDQTLNIFGVGGVLCEQYYAYDSQLFNCSGERYHTPGGRVLFKQYSYGEYYNPLYEVNKLLRIGAESSFYYLDKVYGDGDILLETYHVISYTEDFYPTEVEVWMLGHKIRAITYEYE